MTTPKPERPRLTRRAVDHAVVATFSDPHEVAYFAACRFLADPPDDQYPYDLDGFRAAYEAGLWNAAEEAVAAAGFDLDRCSDEIYEAIDYAEAGANAAVAVAADYDCGREDYAEADAFISSARGPARNTQRHEGRVAQVTRPLRGRSRAARCGTRRRRGSRRTGSGSRGDPDEGDGSPNDPPQPNPPGEPV